MAFRGDKLINPVFLGVLHWALLSPVSGCDRWADPPPVPRPLVVEKPKPVSVRTEEVETPPRETPTCEDQIRERGFTLSNEQAVESAPALPFIVLRAKTLPVFYFAEPKRTDDKRAKRFSDELADVSGIRKKIRSVRDRYKTDKAFLREVFLSQGYFYEDRVDVAPAVIKEITLPDLFDEPLLYRLRDGEIETLARCESEYCDPNGIRAALLLNDRVAAQKEALLPLLHVDVSEVRRLTFAQRARAKALENPFAIVELVFPDRDVRPALLEVKGAATEVICIGGNPATLEASLDRAEAFWKQHERLVEAAERFLSERIMFDEPKDEAEDVQEDGDLRLEWTRAYGRRKKSFTFREVEYPVFDRRGNPTPPQVCVDFIFDAWERAHGTWYQKRKTTPGRTEGTIDFSLLPELSRRHIASVLEYAELEETPLERYDIPRRQWIPYEKRLRFPKNLARHTDAIREGDALVIHGLREEDMEEHFHTVLVLETDPITGIPTLVADNQGRPRIWSLARAMQTAPKRSIKYRLRVDFEKMRKLTETLRAEKAAEKQVSGD
jgi:hypothetical protein